MHLAFRDRARSGSSLAAPAARQAADDRVDPAAPIRRARSLDGRRHASSLAPTRSARWSENSSAAAAADRAACSLTTGRPVPSSTRRRAPRAVRACGRSAFPLVGRLGRRAHHAREHARPDAVDVGPGTQLLLLPVQLGGREARRVHREQLRRVLREGLPRRAEIEQHRRAVQAQVDVGRLQVQVEHPVGVHLAQPVRHLGEHPPHVALGDHDLAVAAAVPEDDLLQASSLLVGHHQVDGLVGAEEIHHAHHVRVQDPRERPPLLEEALQAVAVGGEVVRRDHRRELALLAAHQRAGQVLLDGEALAAGILGEIDDGEPAAGDLSYNTVPADLEAVRQRCVRLGTHACRRRSSVAARARGRAFAPRAPLEPEPQE